MNVKFNNFELSYLMEYTNEDYRCWLSSFSDKYLEFIKVRLSSLKNCKISEYIYKTLDIPIVYISTDTCETGVDWDTIYLNTGNDFTVYYEYPISMDSLIKILGIIDKYITDPTTLKEETDTKLNLKKIF